MDENLRNRKYKLFLFRFIFCLFKIFIYFSIEKTFLEILKDEMNFYTNEMKIPDSIARNDALKENIFSIVGKKKKKFEIFFFC